MTEKRFEYIEATDWVDEHIIDHNTEPRFEHYFLKSVTDKMNVLDDENQKIKEENEQLKQQLLCDRDSVCDICKHEYFIPKDNYFIVKCRKGHEECSKEDIKYCEDFKLTSMVFGND